MQVLRLGSIGPDVQRWQHFLLGQGYYIGIVEGSYGPKTAAATSAFQSAQGLIPHDGEVGRQTYAKAIALGFGDIHDDDKENGPEWPPRPSLLSPSQALREQLFGRFKYRPIPMEGNPERIDVLDGWVEQNIALFEIPQLKNVRGAPSTCKVQFHKKVGPRVQALFLEWQKAGLLNLISSWEGSYTARFVRGSTSTLSAHSHGSAFDINARYNPIGAEPALVGSVGSVRKLVPIASSLGFYWGGFFKARKDGMHFEVARLM